MNTNDEARQSDNEQHLEGHHRLAVGGEVMRLTSRKKYLLFFLSKIKKQSINIDICASKYEYVISL